MKTLIRIEQEKKLEYTLTSIDAIFIECNSKLIAVWMEPARPGRSPDISTPPLPLVTPWYASNHACIPNCSCSVIKNMISFAQYFCSIILK